jgi:hypothetical protein
MLANPTRYIRLIPASVALACVLVPCVSAASGVVTNCTDANLRAALSGGGTVTFACDGTITLTNTLNIAAHTVLDGTGREVVLSGGGTVRPFVVNSGFQFTLKNVTVANGFSMHYAGALMNHGSVRLIDCTFSNNMVLGSPGFGGAIYQNTGSLEASGCAFLFNGALVGTNSSVAVGGAISGGYSFLGPAGRLNLTNCTFFGNTSSRGTISIECNVAVNGSVNVVNCTIAGNTNGGLSYCQGQPGNTNRLVLVNTLLSDNHGPNCTGVVDGGYNVSSDASGGFAHPFSVQNVDPRLGPLASNGGPTLTMALLADSTAIDGGSPSGCGSTDQRGTPRPFGAACDIGAFEATYAGNHAGVFQFGLATNAFTESNQAVTVTVVRAGGTAGSATVDFATSNLTATAGSDFMGTNGVLSFAAGQRTNTFELHLFDDSSVEGTEKFSLVLSNPGGGSSLGRPVAEISILDNEASLAFGSSSYAGAEGGGAVTLTVVRAGNTSVVSSVSYATSSGSAGGGDYRATNGTLTFNPGQTSATFSVAITSDPLVEPDETFNVALSSPSSGAVLISPMTASVTIYDDDGIRVVSNCDDSSLRLALSIGGNVALDCDGTIVLTNTLTIAVNTLLDASGQQVVLSGGGTVRPLVVNSGVQFTMKNVTVANGFGAVTSIGGGGLLNNGSARLIDCTFSNNVCTGISFGGAIFHGTGALDIASCTFVQNRAATGGGAIGGGYTMPSGPLTITNSTFYGNSPGAVSYTCGIFNGQGPGLMLNCTVAHNTNGGVAIGICGLATKTMTLRSTILAYNNGANGSGIVDGGYNLSTDGSAAFNHPTTQTNLDPGLGPLANNGGQTLTMALLDASPATDAGDPAASPPTDQRGFPRPYGIGPDRGAFETTLIGPNPGAFRLSTSTSQPIESDSALLFTVLRADGAFGTATVNFATADLGATAGVDYFATNGTLTFAPGEVQQTFAVRLRDDAAQEADEMFTVALSSQTGGATLGNPSAITVTIVDDETPLIVSVCDDASLRAAIAARSIVTFACDGVIVLTNTLVINGSTRLDATGHSVVLSGSNAVRLFTIQPGATLALHHLTLADGYVRGANGATGQPGGRGEGGAVYNNGGVLLANDCVFVRNKAFGGQGGRGVLSQLPPNVPGGVGGKGAGGAIFSSNGGNFLTNVVFTQNSATGGRGGDLPGGQPAGASGTANGGAICLSGGKLVIHNGCFTESAAAFGDPGMGMRIATTTGVAGGALYSDGGNVAITSSSFVGNACGLGLRDEAVVLAGSASGGAVYLQAAEFALSDTSFLNNRARGGPTYAFSFGGFPGGNGFGGAVFVNGEGGLTNCTLAGNLAQGGPFGSGPAPSSGSGLGGAIYNQSALVLHNTTIAENTARGGEPALVPGNGLGGGIFNGGGVISLLHATLAGNRARRSVSIYFESNYYSLGGGIFSTNGTVSLFNTIVASSPSGSNGFGVFIDGGHNLSSDASFNFTAPGSLNNANPVLGPLADYGGPTLTMALLAGSPAIDAADTAFCPTTDQRGHARPFGAGCDIGAFESSSPYTVLGRVSGFLAPASPIVITSGPNSVHLDTNGSYAFHGLNAGSYLVTPASSECVFVLSNRLVSVGPDVVAVDFHSYRSNALVLERTTGAAVRGVFAGEAGQTYRLLASPDLAAWTPHSTNTTASSGLFEFLETAPLPPRYFFQVVRP